MDAGARRTAPWRARFDGFVVHRKPKSIISYRILVAKRSESESVCMPHQYPAYVPTCDQCAKVAHKKRAPNPLFVKNA